MNNTWDEFLKEYTPAEGIYITNKGALVYTLENSKLANKEELEAICTEYNKLVKGVKE